MTARASRSLWLPGRCLRKAVNGPVVGARRELPLPRDAGAADARVRADRARPVDDAGAVLVRRHARGHRGPGPRRPGLHAQAAPGAAGARPPGVGAGHPVRHRAARAPAGAADAGRVRRAHRAGRPPRRPPSRPLPPALGDVGDRGLQRRRWWRPDRGLPEDAPRHRGRRLRGQPDLAPVQPRAGRRAARRPAGEEGLAARARPRRAARAGAAHQLHPAVHDGRPAGTDREGRGRHHRPGPRRYGDGGPADRSADVVQRHHHRSPRDRARPDGPRHHQGGQGGHRHHRQRRGSRRGRRRAALLPRGPRRAARQLAARDRPGLGPLGVEALRAPTRSRRSSRDSAPTSRTRWSGSRTWRPPTATPRSTTRRSAPTHCRTGPSSRRRARSGSRSARTPRSAWPSGTRSCTTW